MIFYGKKKSDELYQKDSTNKWAFQNCKTMNLGLLAQSCDFGDPETEELQAQWPCDVQRGFKASTDNLKKILS